MCLPLSGSVHCDGELAAPDHGVKVRAVLVQLCAGSPVRALCGWAVTAVAAGAGWARKAGDRESLTIVKAKVLFAWKAVVDREGGVCALPLVANEGDVVGGWEIDETVDKLVLGVEVGVLLENEVVAGGWGEVEDVVLGGVA